MKATNNNTASNTVKKQIYGLEFLGGLTLTAIVMGAIFFPQPYIHLLGMYIHLFK